MDCEKLIVYKNVLLGKGSFADVYFGRWKNNFVAVKEFRFEGSTKPSELDNLQKEVDFLE